MQKTNYKQTTNQAQVHFCSAKMDLCLLVDKHVETSLAPLHVDFVGHVVCNDEMQALDRNKVLPIHFQAKLELLI